jgi:hypothetical protein
MYFFNDRIGCPEVDQETGLDQTGSQVPEQLRDMLVGDSAYGLKFDDQPSLDKEIREILPGGRSVLIEHTERVLLLNHQSGFPQAMRQSVLVNLL